MKITERNTSIPALPPLPRTSFIQEVGKSFEYLSISRIFVSLPKRGTSGTLYRYLEVARRSSDVVWKRGLLTKGNGICHGVAGNGYAFLALRKADAADGRHLHRARIFAGGWVRGSGTVDEFADFAATYYRWLPRKLANDNKRVKA